MELRMKLYGVKESGKDTDAKTRKIQRGIEISPSYNTSLDLRRKCRVLSRLGGRRSAT